MVCEICDDGGCSVCFKTESDEPQFASMKEIEEFYNINGESMHIDPAEMDLEGLLAMELDSSNPWEVIEQRGEIQGNQVYNRVQSICMAWWLEPDDDIIISRNHFHYRLPPLILLPLV